MSHVGTSDDWAECHTCDWTTIGTWALSEAAAHSAEHAGHEMMCHAATSGGGAITPTKDGCPTCEAVAFFREWSRWVADERVVWAEAEADDEIDEPAEGLLQFDFRPHAPNYWLRAIGDTDEEDATLRLVRHLRCGLHDMTEGTG